MEEAANLTDRDGIEILDPQNEKVPYGTTVLDEGSKDVAIYKMLENYVDFVRARTVEQLQNSGLIGRNTFERIAIKAGGGYYLYYRLVQRGKQATIAVDLDTPFHAVNAYQFGENLDLLRDAFPIFLGCIANTKAKVPNVPRMVQIHDINGNHRWTLMIDLDVPAIKGSKKVGKLVPSSDWIFSKKSVAILLSHPICTDAIKKLDTVAFRILDEANAYHRRGGKYLKALKIGLKRDIEKALSNPVQFTRLLVIPVLGALGVIPNAIDEQSFILDLFEASWEANFPVELQGFVKDGQELFEVAEAYTNEDSSFDDWP